jgi:MinD-like ATPase involved in chromosome partitioning or flagellar assembly
VATKRTKSTESGQLVDVLPAKGTTDLATKLPQSLSVEVKLPAPVRKRPSHEAAVAIEPVAVDPSGVDSLTVSTTSIDVIHTGPIHVDVDEPEAPEAADSLTEERLISARRRPKQPPEGRWPELVYALSFHLVNIGDSARVRERKALEARIAKKFEGGTRFVPILTRKGGVGKTTITAILGMAMADVRDEPVIAIDANPDRGTLAERVNKQTRATVRDAVLRAASIASFNDFTDLVSRDETRLDIIASDSDPLLSEAFDENDYNVVADLASRFYSIVLTDCGTGIVHSVMRATLQRADSIVVVSGGSIDEARLASETLTWLEANGYGELVRNSIVAINTGTQGTNLVKLEEIEAHFQTRVREIVRIPYDSHLAAGSVINFKDLAPITRDAARDLAALVADGLPATRTA